MPLVVELPSEAWPLTVLDMMCDSYRQGQRTLVLVKMRVATCMEVAMFVFQSNSDFWPSGVTKD